MKILLDQNITRRLARFMAGHLVLSARSLGFDTLENGDLIRAAEAQNFDLMITADRGIYYQQNNAARQLALLVLTSNRWATLRAHITLILEAVDRTAPGGFEKLQLPLHMPPER